MTKNCEHCQAEFTAQRKSHRFCAPRCRKAAWRASRPVASRRVPDANPDIRELAAKVDLILHKLDSINVPPASRGGAAMPSGGMSGTLAARNASDDDDLASSLEITTATSNVNAGQNLIDAMLRIGATVKNPNANGNGRGKGPKAMDVPSELSPPNFDDMDDISVDVAEATVR